MNKGTLASPFYGTFIEAWSERLAAMSFEHRAIELSPADQRALISHEPASRALINTASEPLAYSEPLKDSIASILAMRPEGSFLRLGACSFVTTHRRPTRIRSLDEAMQLLKNPGARAAKMVYRCLVSEHPVALYVRRWHDIPLWSEFRLFIRDGELVGVSQYHDALMFRDLSVLASAFQHEICQFTSELLPRLAMPSVVADICILPSGASKKIHLIEINPFMHVTGAALFDWNQKDDFDATFRFRDADGRVVRVPLETLNRQEKS